MATTRWQPDMRDRLRRLWKRDETFYAFLALLFVAILRSPAEHQSPVEAYLWILVILAGVMLMLEGLVRGYSRKDGGVVSDRTLEEVRRDAERTKP